MKINKREVILVLLTAAVVVFAFVLMPLAGWWSARAVQLKELRVKVSEGNALLTRESVIRSHWREMQANALPANNSAAEQQLLKAFDTWRNDTGAELTSIMPQWKSDSTNYMTLNCHIELGGSLGTLSRYLYELEKSPLALRVDTVELSGRDKEGQQLTLGLEVSGLALNQQEKK